MLRCCTHDRVDAHLNFIKDVISEVRRSATIAVGKTARPAADESGLSFDNELLIEIAQRRRRWLSLRSVVVHHE